MVDARAPKELLIILHSIVTQLYAFVHDLQPQNNLRQNYMT